MARTQTRLACNHLLYTTDHAHESMQLAISTVRSCHSTGSHHMNIHIQRTCKDYSQQSSNQSNSTLGVIFNSTSWIFNASETAIKTPYVFPTSWIFNDRVQQLKVMHSTASYEHIIKHWCSFTPGNSICECCFQVTDPTASYDQSTTINFIRWIWESYISAPNASHSNNMDLCCPRQIRFHSQQLMLNKHRSQHKENRQALKRKIIFMNSWC